MYLSFTGLTRNSLLKTKKEAAFLRAACSLWVPDR